MKQAESEQIVAALEKRGLGVTYVVYPDEGHGFARPENAMDFNARSEAFLGPVPRWAIRADAGRAHPRLDRGGQGHRAEDRVPRWALSRRPSERDGGDLRRAPDAHRRAPEAGARGARTRAPRRPGRARPSRSTAPQTRPVMGNICPPWVCPESWSPMPFASPSSTARGWWASSTAGRSGIPCRPPRRSGPTRAAARAARSRPRPPGPAARPRRAGSPCRLRSTVSPICSSAAHQATSPE